MKIDIKERINKHQKAKRFYLVVAISFFVLAIASIFVFIFLSNYKIQLMMSIVGSISSSLLMIISIGFLTIGYLPNKYLFNFYEQLENKEEQSLTDYIKVSKKELTLKKGLSFLVIYIDKQEYYVIDKEMASSLKEDEKYQIIIRGNYVMEIKGHE